MTARLLLAVATLALVLPGCGSDEPEPDVTVVAPEGLPWADTDSMDAPATNTPDAGALDAGGKGDAEPSAPAASSAAKPGAAPPAPPAPTGGKPSGANRPAAPAGGETERFSGALAYGDETLDDGEFIDTYEIEATAGQTITVDLAGAGFDTYLILRAPSDEQTDNDDLDGDTERSQIVHEATESGTWTVGVTSYGAGETGDYRLTVRTAAGR